MANQFDSVAAGYNILKIYYQGPIVSQFNDMIPLYQYIEKGKEKFNGQQVNRPLKVRRNPGIGAVAESGNLPKIGKQTTVQAIIAAKYNYLRFGVTGPMLKASQGDKGAFVSAVEFEMSEGLNDLKQDVNRQLFWDGTSDLATVSVNAVASQTITVAGRETTEDGNKYLDIDVVVDIYTAAGALVASGLTITGLSGTTTATVTFDQVVTTSATDVLVRSGTFGNEVQGLLYSQDGATSTIFSVDRSQYSVYGGNLVSNNGNQLTLNFLQQTYNQGLRRGGNQGGYDAMFCDYDSERFYTKLLVADKRYVGTVSGDGTFSKKDGSYLEFAGRKLVPDKDSPQRFFFLDTSTWKKYVLCELEWADEWGSTLFPQTDVDAFEARLRLFFNLFPEKPSANAVASSYISP